MFSWSQFAVFVGISNIRLLLGAKIEVARLGELSLAGRLQGS